jgi:hypothetical protein
LFAFQKANTSDADLVVTVLVDHWLNELFLSPLCLGMENASTQGDKGKQPTKATASARRAKAAENPQKKWSKKRLAELEAAHPEPQHGEGVAV